MPEPVHRHPRRGAGSRSPVRAALRKCRAHFVGIAVFSAVVNILYLTPTLFMLQVYERVLGTGSGRTLTALALACLGGLATLALLDWLRSRLLVRATARLDRVLAGDVMRAVLSRTSLNRMERADALRQFDALRQGLGSPAVLAAFDAPWAPIYIAVSFVLHPALGCLSVAACLVLLALAWSNERAVHRNVAAAQEAASVSYAYQQQITAFAAEVRALGMRDAMVVRQLRDRADSNGLQVDASLVSGNHMGFIKFVRLVLQSAALCLGGWLAINGAIHGGAVFAASLLLSKAVQPIEQIVGAWKGLLQSYGAYHKVDAILGMPPLGERMALPDPTGAIEIEHLTVLTPESERVALADINLTFAPGEVVGVVGLSGAGKSTLLRALAGASVPARGTVRFDGAAYADWDPAQITRHIGYLPQEFVLFPGTIKENISRFAIDLGADPAAVGEAVVAAARLVGVHDRIVRLADGYETRIGMGGVGLSAGQTQRIALARALYGEPRVLILDEPNAHLDAEADFALIQLISHLKARGTTVILAAHSGDLLASADKLLMLQEGRVARFGPIVAQKGALAPAREAQEI